MERRTAASGLAICVVLFLGLPAPSANALPSGFIGDPCGVILSTPGVARLSIARSNCAADGITINASHVTLDLGGRVIQGNGTGAGFTGVKINPGMHDVVVRNGTLTNFQTGVSSPKNNVLSNLVLRANGTAITADGDLIRNNVVVGGSTGIEAGANGHVAGNVLARVVSADPSLVSGGHNLIEHNRFFANSGGLGGNNFDRVIGNLSAGNASNGLSTGGTNLVRNNRAFGNGTGIVVGKDSVAAHNVASGNGFYPGGGDGMTATNIKNKLTHNVANGNASSGIEVAGSNAVTRNIANGNLLDGVLGFNQDAYKHNVVKGNYIYGINGGSSPTGQGTNIARINSCAPNDLCVPAPAPTGTEISIDCAGSVTTDINAPGLYRLARSVLDCGSDPAVHITSPNVIFDLGGNRIDGDETGAYGIRVDPALENVVVRNGTLSDWFVGVSSGGKGSVVTGIIARHNAVGINGNPGAMISGNVVVSNVADGLLVGDSVVVTRNIIAGNGTYGINAASKDVITRNVIAGNGTGANDYGIYVTNQAEISNNLIAGNRGGIIGDGVISHNRIVGNLGGAVYVGTHSVITRNVIRGNDGVGISAPGSGNKMLNNIIEGNVNGIFTSSGPTVIGNVVSGNLGGGISAGQGAVIRNNAANGNETYGITAQPDATGSGNTARFNGGVACDPPGLCR